MSKTGMSTLCAYCRQDWEAKRNAEQGEKEWAHSPSEVAERKCVRCKRIFKWWWFRKEEYGY